MIELLYSDKEIAVVRKPAGVPSQSDPSGDPDAMSLTSEWLLSRSESPTLFLLHRLDRTVGGVLAFARTKEATARLSRFFSEGGMEKTYFAVVDSLIEEEGAYTDFLFKDARQGKAFPVTSLRKGAKEARLSFRRLATVEKEGKTYSLLAVKLETGRFHQIRCQLAAHRHPIVGDGKYGSRDGKARMPALFCTSLAFPASSGLVKTSFTALPDLSLYPFALFSEKDYSL